jgi:hypothetical protein
MTALLLAAQLPSGVVLGMVLTAALAVVLLLFGAGYWYLVKRNHQGDDTTEHYPTPEESGPPE